MRKLLIRADASTEIGTGHLMRCLALAQAWHAEGGRVTFLSRCDSPALRRRVREEGARFIPLPAAHPDPTDWQTMSQLVRKL
jgi:spore coat polysaccharide biosynthesis predicted glycosyltransferase SpsG